MSHVSASPSPSRDSERMLRGKCQWTFRFRIKANGTLYEACNGPPFACRFCQRRCRCPPHRGAELIRTMNTRNVARAHDHNGTPRFGHDDPAAAALFRWDLRSDRGRDGTLVESCGHPAWCEVGTAPAQRIRDGNLRAQGRVETRYGPDLRDSVINKRATFFSFRPTCFIRRST